MYRYSFSRFLLIAPRLSLSFLPDLQHFGSPRQTGRTVSCPGHAVYVGALFFDHRADQCGCLLHIAASVLMFHDLNTFDLVIFDHNFYFHRSAKSGSGAIVSAVFAGLIFVFRHLRDLSTSGCCRCPACAARCR